MRLGLLAAFAAICAAQDAREIVRRSVALDDRNSRLQRDYTFIERQEFRELDARSAVKRRDIKSFDVTVLEGSPYRRLIARGDKPLPPAEEAAEQEKLRKSIEQRREESPAGTRKRLAEWERHRRRVRDGMNEIPDAFDLKLTGEERLDGREVWVIDAAPRRGYRARSGMIARFFPKMRGRFWIDKQDYQWVKVDAEVLDTISFGLLLARIGKGTQFTVEQARVNDEVWLPKRVAAKADARIALLRKVRGEFDITYSNYRKFQADSRIVTSMP